MQRLTKYPLLLDNIAKYTGKGGFLGKWDFVAMLKSSSVLWVAICFFCDLAAAYTQENKLKPKQSIIIKNNKIK